MNHIVYRRQFLWLLPMVLLLLFMVMQSSRSLYAAPRVQDAGTELPDAGLPTTVTPNQVIPGVVVAPTQVTEATAIQAAFGREYAVTNDPLNLAVEAPGRIWYTSAGSDGIGVVTVTSAPDAPIIRYRTEFFHLGNGSDPYDLVYEDGLVWFTLRGANQLGVIDTTTHEIETFMLPTPNSTPTVLVGSPEGLFWMGTNSARLLSFDPLTTEFTEYPFPAALEGQPRVGGIAYESTRAIWFTLPEANLVANYNSVNGRFFTTPTGADGQGPTSIHLDSNDNPWVTASRSGKLGRYAPTTVTSWVWFDTFQPDSGPLDHVMFNNGGVLEVWVAQSNTGSAERLSILNGFQVVNREVAYLATPPGRPWAIIQSPDKHLWVSDRQRNVLYELTPPYIYRLMLPILYPRPNSAADAR